MVFAVILTPDPDSGSKTFYEGDLLCQIMIAQIAVLL